MGPLSSVRSAPRVDLVSPEFCEDGKKGTLVMCWTRTGFDTDSKVDFGSSPIKYPVNCTTRWYYTILHIDIPQT
ncbi:unnamed protein product [Prunus armeniaca]